MTEDDHRVARSRRLHRYGPGGAVGGGMRFRRLRHGCSRGEFGRYCWSADERRRQGLPSGESGVLVVPELHGWLAEPPAQKHAPAIQLAREVDQTNATVLELNAQRLELRL